MSVRAALLLTGIFAAATASAQGPFESLGERLQYASATGSTWASLSGQGDLTGYALDTPPPGLLFTRDARFLAPRLMLMLDGGYGERVSVHVQVRADRGFDPGLERDGDVRFDEYYVQATLNDDWRLQVRAGKFATAFGRWVERHLPWDNPLITAPALYDDLVTVVDRAAPPDRATFAARRDQPENKSDWLPIIWGPSYATGALVTAGSATLDLALEVKNASLSSRPSVWDAVQDGFGDRPTTTARIAWHPSAAWTLGTSYSVGPYLLDEARASLPAGVRLRDVEQATFGVDLGFALHRLQVWSEIAHVRFDVPRVGSLDATAGFVEARYKFATRYWVAGRWNHARFEDTPGFDRTWERNLNRYDLGIGYRHSSHVQAKLEYAHTQQAGGNTMGRHLLAAQIGLRF